MEHSYIGCQRTVDDTKSEHSKNWHDLESFIKYSQQRVDEFRRYGQMSLLALSVRIVATYLRATLPLNKMIAHNRVEHLRESVKDYGIFRQSFAKKLLNTCDTIDAKFRFETTIEDAKSRAKSKVNCVDDMLIQHEAELSRAIENVARRLAEADSAEIPLRWYAQIDSENQVTLSCADGASEAPALGSGKA